jgi:CheY-like chemotaxis protein
VTAPNHPRRLGSGPHRLAGGSETPRVLIVEDQEETRDLYTWCLRTEGWQVEAVPNGEELVFLAAAFAPDVIVMDLCMPVIGGIEATRRLKSNALTRHIPVVAVSAMHREDGKAMALEAGCEAFVPKPCLPAELNALLQKFVGPREP